LMRLQEALYVGSPYQVNIFFLVDSGDCLRSLTSEVIMDTVLVKFKHSHEPEAFREVFYLRESSDNKLATVV
jgi:hypothetical protein